jgi:hypothetical protein
MLDKFFELLYPKIFVNIIPTKSTLTVYIEVVSRGVVSTSYEDEFDTPTIDNKVKNFIDSHINDSPFYYISIIDISPSQGALPTCQRDQFPLYQDISGSEHMCYKKRWTPFSYKEELYEQEKKFKKIGLDLIFSPFIVLESFFKDKIDNEMILCVLVQEDSVSISVYNQDELLYAQHLDLDAHEEDEPLMIYDDSEDIDFEDDILDDGIDLEDIDTIDEINEFGDFDDIEDLDSLEDMDEFSEKDIEEELQSTIESVKDDEEPNEKEISQDGSSDDYKRFTLIQNSINNYYKDGRYNSEFIQTAYIADGVGLGQNLKQYLEDEMFFTVYVRKIDLSDTICELAKLEIN